MRDETQQSRLQAILLSRASAVTRCGQLVDMVALPCREGSIAVCSVPSDGTISSFLVSTPVGTLFYEVEHHCWWRGANQFDSNGWTNTNQPIRAGLGLLSRSRSAGAGDVPSSEKVSAVRTQKIDGRSGNFFGLQEGKEIPELINRQPLNFESGRGTLQFYFKSPNATITEFGQASDSDIPAAAIDSRLFQEYTDVANAAGSTENPCFTSREKETEGE